MRQRPATRQVLLLVLHGDFLHERWIVLRLRENHIPRLSCHLILLEIGHGDAPDEFVQQRILRERLEDQRVAELLLSLNELVDLLAEFNEQILRQFSELNNPLAKASANRSGMALSASGEGFARFRS